MPPDPLSSTPLFLLLFRNGGPETHAHLTNPERTALTAKWNEWCDRLIAQGALEQGKPLGLGGRVVEGPEGERVTDGPYAEAHEVIAGFLMLRASNLDQATELARGCPGLPLGLTIEVRPVQDFSPVLGEVRGRDQAVAR